MSQARPSRLAGLLAVARRRWYLGAAGVALIALLAWALAPRPVQVEVASVTRGPFETAIEEDGKTRLRDQYVVSAPLAGLLARISLREGDPVAEGAVVANIRPSHAPLLDERTRREQQARLGAAQAQLGAAEAAEARAAVAWRQAQHDAGRSEQLARAGFVASSQLESAQLAALSAKKEYDSSAAQRQVARHDVEQARAALEMTADTRRPGSDFAVRAPIAGRVMRVVQASEVVVALGAPLLELGNSHVQEVVAELLSADAVLSRPGSEVRIDRWGGPVLRGRVRLVEPQAFTKISALGVEEQRVRVLIDLLDTDPAAAALGVGYRVNVHIVTAHADQVRKVPVSALFPLPGERTDAMAVYVLRNGRAHLAPVALAGRNEREAWVRDGLAVGDRVIIYPSAEVHDGAAVRARDVGRTP